MTNKDKAKELAKQLLADDQNQQPLIDVLLQMAQWKDEQYAELMVKVVEKNEETKRLTRQISDNLNQMLKINNNSTN
jgi:hypothetical protein